MEALLPSEIARLVLGYLEDQKCTEAAKLFLETSPHLQECRTVLSHGRRFNTRVNGLTLLDVVEKLSAISTMIQERLNKVTDCEQLKHCGDLIEQLKFLVEEPRGQRFVVNINVPSQSNTQTSNGSPIITCNMRKRHHSNSERMKRTKSQSSFTQQSDIIMSPPASSHNIDTTPLESLPGNTHPSPQAEYSMAEKRDENISQESHKQYDSDKNNSDTIAHNRNNRISSDDVSSVRSCEMDIDDKKEDCSAISTAPQKYTAATSTEELLSFSSAEVQTVPYEIQESESESNDEPIENLSILTKEILNRTDLQECIAENINKAIIPTDLSFKDDNLNESVEGNTSIMAELNSAIKSIVEATESDPVFEKFLDEIIGPNMETDTSPEEDGEGKLSPKSVHETQEKQVETGLSNISSPEPMIAEVKVPADNETADIPLKHRLRSSSRQQCNRIEDEVDKAKDQEKEQNALEDQNAAAIMSIINANITKNAPDNDKKTLAKESAVTNDDNGQKMETISTANKNNASLELVDSQKANNVVPSTNNNVQSKVKKSTVKRPRATKPKRDQVVSDDQPITEQEIMTMPTLILCSKEEVDNLFINCSSAIKSSSSRFIPIAPKDPDKINNTIEPIYLRTVNVAQVPVRTLPTVTEENDSADQAEPPKKSSKVSKRLKTVHKTGATVPSVINQRALDEPQTVESAPTGKTVGGESITLYGSETSARTSMNDTNMPMINLEENISLSETGLSPYLKLFSCGKTNQSHNLSDIDVASVIESARNTTAGNNGTEKQQSPSADVITKRTPKSLLKSRSKNHRLSLSTPRKRSSHVRALDFSTPTKTISSARKASGEGNTPFLSGSTKRLKSVCRTSLFRSPSLSSTSVQKQKSPMKVCQPYRIPIATRSPAPKLMGGWDKYNGVGVIIGEVSPHGSASCSSSEDRTVQPKPSKPTRQSWDADLRKGIQLEVAKAKKPVKRKRNSTKDKNDMAQAKKPKYSPRSVKSKYKRKPDWKPDRDAENTEENEPEENSRGNTRRAAAITKSRTNEKKNFGKTIINTADSTTNKPDKVLESANTCEARAEANNANAVSSDAATEKKPVKKYAQLKTIATNLRKFDNERKQNMEDAQINSQISEISRVTADSAQYTCPISRLPDMISLETPRKFDKNCLPPTPRVLSPNSCSLITPFIKISEDSSRIRSFITTPEFPITPCVVLTPKEETTRDMIKQGEYNSPYYKPTSEQVQDSEVSKPKSSGAQESPIISSSHASLTHSSLTSSNAYQTCTTSKLEITQFEVIKENLPREEAIKELKIASSSKDSTSTAELNASVVIDQQVDLIQINELKGASETITDDNYVADSHNDPQNDSAESNSSSSSNTSSSSSSSSSTSTNTDTSTTHSSIENCDKAPSKVSTDASSDFAEKNIDAAKSKNLITDDQSADTPSDTRKKSDSAPIEQESSPKKVFAIAKTDAQLAATMKETPAKDEALLNEADISETPSSSKSGMEHLTNLSTKIAAIMTEDEKLSKASRSPEDGSEIQVSKPRAKPKIISIQYIRPGLSRIVESRKPVEDNSQPNHEEVIQQLEEKRQRMIAKIKDTSKSNLSSVPKRKCIPSALKKIGRGQRNILPIATCSRKRNTNRNKNTKQDNLQTGSTINTRKRYKQQKLNLVSKRCDKNEDEEGTKKQVAELKSTDPNSTNHGNNSNNSTTLSHTTKRPHKNKAYDVENNLVENHSKESEFIQSHKNSSSEDQKCLKEKLNAKENAEKSCGIEDNAVKEETGELKTNNTCTTISEQEVTSTEKDIVVQETLVPEAKQEMRDQAEDKINKPKQFANPADKSEGLKVLRYKVDQVKRDLFSDDENDHRPSSTVSAKDNKKVANAEAENLDPADAPKENINAENSKQELSSVLQCLQLVPTHKSEHLHDDENEDKQQHQEQNKYENKSNDNDELDDVTQHYKAEYHFMYDDSAPMRKRRRRNSGYKLQIEINHADISDPDICDPVEYIKILKASDFEEIFNLPPKSKKRTMNKKSPIKNDKNHEMDKDAFTLKDSTAKPLATSSPVDKPVDKVSKAKVKKITKTAAINKIDNAQSDAKKQKLDKHQEKDTTAKIRKRKLSETKETKQIEKKPIVTDPQMLLNSMNKEHLDHLLDQVHGPV